MSNTNDVNSRRIRDIQRREKQQQLAQEQRQREMAEIADRQRAREEALREKQRERQRQDAEEKRQVAERRKLHDEQHERENQSAKEAARANAGEHWRRPQAGSAARLIAAPAPTSSNASNPPFPSTDPTSLPLLCRQSSVPVNIAVDLSKPSPASSMSVAMSQSPDLRRPATANNNKKRPRAPVARMLHPDTDTDSSDEKDTQSAWKYPTRRPFPMPSNKGKKERNPTATHKTATLAYGESKIDSSSDDDDDDDTRSALASVSSKLSAARSAPSQSGPPVAKQKLNFSMLLKKASNSSDSSSEEEVSTAEAQRSAAANLHSSSSSSLKPITSTETGNPQVFQSDVSKFSNPSSPTDDRISVAHSRVPNHDSPLDALSSSKKRRPRNPLALMKDEYPDTFSADSKGLHCTTPLATTTASLNVSPPPVLNGAQSGDSSRSCQVDRNAVNDVAPAKQSIAPDDLWDSDNDAEVAAAHKKLRSRATQDTNTNETKSTASTYKSPSDKSTDIPRSKRVDVCSSHLLANDKEPEEEKQVPGDNQPYQQGYESDDDSASEKYSASTLHPHFEAPYFGPFDNEPMLLIDERNELQYEMPLSINRYLPNYQQEGIEFMFDRLAKGCGAILGDDMGLGKTVQVVSLLAALLRKSGTGLDLKELRRRKAHFRERLQAIESAKDEAIRQGRMPSETIPKLSLDMDTPFWAPILLVVPKSVLDQWLEALKNWGHFAVEVLQSCNEVSRLITGESEILLCTHSQFNKEMVLAELASVSWKLVIIDEFHIFKNEKSKWAVHLRALRAQQPGFLVLGLTGTLMQNKHEELWNLIDLVVPNFLGSWAQFKSEYALPIKLAEKKDADIATKELGKQKSAEFKKSLLPKVFLQRFKDDVLRDQLPAKDEKIVLCELSDIQKEVYMHILKQPDFVLVSQAAGPCDCESNEEFFRQYKRLPSRAQKIDYLRRHKDHIKSRARCHHRAPWDRSSSDGISPKAVLWRQLPFHNAMSDTARPSPCESCPWCLCFPTIGILSRLCSHVSLLQASKAPDAIDSNETKDLERAQAELERAKVFLPSYLIEADAIPGGYIRRNGVMDKHDELSGKMKMLRKLLTRIYERNGRALIFSTYTTTLDIIESFVRMKYKYLRMDGSTLPAKKKERIKAFKSDPNVFVFLLSTRAMGLGLNLTEANNVIIYDVEWNPAWDAQAQDRVFRIGQEQDVKVYRLVARGTLEELKYLRQVYKNQLKDRTIAAIDEVAQDSTKREFRGIANDKQNKGELFGMANLLKYRDGTFMRYGSSSSYQNKDDIQQIGVADIAATVGDMDEGDLDDFGGLGCLDEIDELAELRESKTPGHGQVQAAVDAGYESDATAVFEEYGAESQMNIDICENVDVGDSMLGPSDKNTNAPPSSTKVSPVPSAMTRHKGNAILGSSGSSKLSLTASNPTRQESEPSRGPLARSYKLHLPTNGKKAKKK